MLTADQQRAGKMTSLFNRNHSRKHHKFQVAALLNTYILQKEKQLVQQALANITKQISCFAEMKTVALNSKVIFFKKNMPLHLHSFKVFPHIGRDSCQEAKLWHQKDFTSVDLL